MLLKMQQILSKYFRNKRMKQFFTLFNTINYETKILDVGGEEDFWIPYLDKLRNCSIYIVNIKKTYKRSKFFRNYLGDARNISQFPDNYFDIVFSNSVIEHVGSFSDQRKMADEIRRLGKSYYIQTPNYYFPIEPHFLFPFFHFLPLRFRLYLLTRFNLGHRKRCQNILQAQKAIKSVNLLKKKDIIKLFPDSIIVEEKFLIFTKSFIVYKILR